MTDSLHIRPHTPEDDERALQIENTIFDDRPPTTVEEYRHRVSSLPGDIQRTAVVAERDGRIVGRAVWSRFIHVADPTAFRLSITVDPPEQGHGVGSALYNRGIDALQKLGAGTVYGSIREAEEHARSFISHRGFRGLPGGGDRPSRLNIASARLDSLRAADERARASAIRITTVAELGADDATLREIWSFEQRTSHDIPAGIEWEGFPYDLWRDLVVRGPTAALHAIWIALDGERVIGMANLQIRSGNTAENGYTAVDAEYRGKGIARALKLRTVEWAREHGITYLYTTNHANNLPMIRINDEMGYEPLPTSVEVLKDLKTD
jgi:GNAT superfamily N-acetyltransferase